MKFEQALGRIGVTIAKADQNPGRITLLLRVDQQRAGLWVDTLTEYLLASADARVTWKTDVSKYFYPVPEAGVVRFLWRVVLLVDPRSAAEALGRAAQRAMAAGVEVTSQPLVGRKKFEFNPAEGKIGGAHDPKKAAAILGSQGVQ